MTVDNAQMRYFIVHLHRLLEPDQDDAQSLTEPARRATRLRQPSPPTTVRTGRVVARLLRECMLPNWRVLAVAVAAMAVTAATAGALPFLLQRVADERVRRQGRRRLLFVLPVLVVVVMSFRAGADWVVDASPRPGSAPGSSRTCACACSTRSPPPISPGSSAPIPAASSPPSSTTRRSSTAPRPRSLTALFKNGLSVVFLVGAMFYMDWRLSAPGADRRAGRRLQPAAARSGASPARCAARCRNRATSAAC